MTRATLGKPIVFTECMDDLSSLTSAKRSRFLSSPGRFRTSRQSCRIRSALQYPQSWLPIQIDSRMFRMTFVRKRGLQMMVNNQLEDTAGR